ncbi:MAG TPA: metallophosphoesterase [Rickettsiales bacterium]|nr:metallophosphoesterase [Rickettsiales bacterium]
MSIFLSTIAFILALVHYYCYDRLCFYFDLNGAARIVAAGIATLLWFFSFTSLPLMWALPLKQEKRVAWIVFPWLGILLLLFTTLLAGDVLTGTLFLSVGWREPPDAWQATKEMTGVAIVAVAGTLSLIALYKGLRPVPVKRVDVTLRRLPEAFDGFHIVQLTDLHIGPMIGGRWLARVVEQTNALKPDLIAITGDLVDGSVDDLAEAASALKDLRAKHGVYFVTGNHEHYSGAAAWTAYLQSLGIRVLTNERVTLTKNSAALDLAGVEDFDSHRFPGHGPDLGTALEGRDPETPVVLLAHQPAAVAEAAEMGVDLQLAGHTHGGQIRPFDLAVKLRQPYVKGLHHITGSNTKIYISSGTGYWGPPMRLGTTSEITSLRLLKEVQN